MPICCTMMCSTKGEKQSKDSNNLMKSKLRNNNRSQKEGILNENYTPRNKRPVEDFLKLQGRFKHLFNKENEQQRREIQAAVDANWEALQKKCDMG